MAEQAQLQSNAAVGPDPAPAPSDGGATGVAGGAAGGQQTLQTSLYVGDLDVNVSDSQLAEHFDQFGEKNKVVSVRVCRDTNTRRSLGYGYVNYDNPEIAAEAIEKFNFSTINGKSIRVMYSQRDNTLRKDGKGNIFIKNLDKRIDSKFLHSTFSEHGNILSCKVSTDASGQSRGYGFVQYDNEDSAKVAIEKMNGKLIMDKEIFVGVFVRRQLRENDKMKFNNVYVKNLSESVTDEDLKKIFGEFGLITSAIVMKDLEGKSKCFGFVNFEKSDDAAKAVEALNGNKFDDKEWYVGRAQKKAERDAELKLRYEQHLKEAVDKYKGTNLYIKNLDDSIDDDKLEELFSPFGSVASCKVMRDPNGVSKGSGFVAFTTAEEASRAMAEMKGKMVATKPLYVAVAERKEDRIARLQAQFSQSQMLPMVMPPAMAQQMPMYPPAVPGLGQQIYFGQGSPSIIPPQPAFGYQHQLVNGLRPGGAPAPNFFVPMLQHAQRPAGRRPMQQPIQMMQQQQLLPRGRPRHPQARGPQSLGPLASLLADAPPETQRVLLGENLYPLVEQLEPEMAAKVTGMLLEMDQTEVLHLLESPDALKAKVSEAMEVLRNVAMHQTPNNAVDHITGLLNDN